MTVTSEGEGKTEEDHPMYGDPVISYFLAFCCSSLMFMFSISEIRHYSLGLALFGWIFAGFLPAQALMTIPWALAVRHYRRARVAGWIYFPVVGATSTVTLGCTVACFMPTLLNVEDQTIFEAASIALERQGPSFMLSGLIFGLTYWLLSIRFPELL